MSVVAFSYSGWTTRYPEMASVSQALAQLYFNEAGLYLDNTDCSPVQDVVAREMLLNMLTAHIAQINAGSTQAQSSAIVGRISSASEGSVSVQVQNDYPPGSPQWYQATKYGAAYWAATAGYRTMLYAANPARPTDPFLPTWGL